MQNHFEEMIVNIIKSFFGFSKMSVFKVFKVNLSVFKVFKVTMSVFKVFKVFKVE